MLNIVALFQREHRKFSPDYGVVTVVRYGKWRHTKAIISSRRGKIGPRLLLTVLRTIHDQCTKAHTQALSILAEISDRGWA